MTFSAKGADSKDQLWIRSLDALTAQRLPGTEGAIHPFWSSDSDYDEVQGLRVGERHQFDRWRRVCGCRLGFQQSGSHRQWKAAAPPDWLSLLRAWREMEG
jgi:hypothetical protein